MDTSAPYDDTFARTRHDPRSAARGVRCARCCPPAQLETSYPCTCPTPRPPAAARRERTPLVPAPATTDRPAIPTVGSPPAREGRQRCRRRHGFLMPRPLMGQYRVVTKRRQPVGPVQTLDTGGPSQGVQPACGSARAHDLLGVPRQRGIVHPVDECEASPAVGRAFSNAACTWCTVTTRPRTSPGQRVVWAGASLLAARLRKSLPGLLGGLPAERAGHMRVVAAVCSAVAQSQPSQPAASTLQRTYSVTPRSTVSRRTQARCHRDTHARGVSTTRATGLAAPREPAPPTLGPPRGRGRLRAAPRPKPHHWWRSSGGGH